MLTYMCARKVGFSLLHVDNCCGHVVKVRRFRAYVFDNMSWTYVYAFARQTVLPLCHMIWSLFDIFVPIDMIIRHLLYMSTYIPSVPSSCFLFFCKYLIPFPLDNISCEPKDRTSPLASSVCTDCEDTSCHS